MSCTHARVVAGIDPHDSQAARATIDDHRVLCQVCPQPPTTVARWRHATRSTIVRTTPRASVSDIPASVAS